MIKIDVHTVNISLDCAEAVAKLARKLTSMETREKHMASVLDRLVEAAEAQRTVVDGLTVLMDEIVQRLRDLAAGNITAEQVNALADEFEANTLRISNAVASGTAAENEPADPNQPVDPNNPNPDQPVGLASPQVGASHPSAAQPGAPAARMGMGAMAADRAAARQAHLSQGPNGRPDQPEPAPQPDPNAPQG